MDYININESFVTAVPVPESLNTDTVTYVVYKSDGTVFASGSATYIAGINWKIAFTPTAADVYIVEVSLERIDVKYSQSFKAVSTSTLSAPLAVDETVTNTLLLSKVNTAINNRLNGGAVQAYSIGGRNIQYATLNELFELRKNLEAAIAIENGGARNYVTFTDPD